MDFKHDPDTDFRPIEALSEGQADEEAAALREGLRHHDWLYYVKSSPTISDARYDRLFERLQHLEAAFPRLRSSDSPTQRVGAAPVNGLRKLEHSAPMLSLESVRRAEDAGTFLQRLAETLGEPSPALALEPKFDGLSVELIFEDGELTGGATRGDGKTGEDITHNLRTLGPLPLRLRSAGQAGAAPPERLAVRAEVLMPRPGFTALNRERVERGEEPFAMPERCPVCGTDIIREGAYHRCPAGLSCRAQLVGHIAHYASRGALDIQGLGEETARSVVDFFAAETNRQVLRRMRQAGVEVQPAADRQRPQTLAGRRFVFTGALERYSRAEAKAAVETRGGRASSDVSGETDYLVVGAHPGGKRERAQAAGVAILDEEGFTALLDRE